MYVCVFAHTCANSEVASSIAYCGDFFHVIKYVLSVILIVHRQLFPKAPFHKCL